MTISYMLSDFMVTDDGNAEARFQVFSCLAILSQAVFIQTTMKVAHEDEEVIAFEKTKAQEVYRRRVNNMFREADTSGDRRTVEIWGNALGDGFIDFQEFKRMLEHPQLQVWLHQLEIQTDDLLGLFGMLDDGDGEISLDPRRGKPADIGHMEEFETGIMKIKGIARSFDLNKLQRQDGASTESQKFRQFPSGEWRADVEHFYWRKVFKNVDETSGRFARHLLMH
eukprot:s404_g21.t1